MKVSVDRDQCISCGVCWSECPELFEAASDDGMCRITEKYRAGGDIAKGEAPETLRDSAKAAAEGCPVSIISVE
jgi:ferredoxin